MKNIRLIAFLLLAVVQLTIPAWMIMHREDIKTAGNEYRFKCRPVDPNDPFRGKYVTLGFEAEELKNIPEGNWQVGDIAYASLGNNQEGYASITKLTQNPPASGDYIEVAVRSAFNDRLRVELPFNRYYMEEFKAAKAERLYQLMSQTTEIVALVKVKDGNSVLTKVLVNGLPIDDAVNELED